MSLKSRVCQLEEVINPLPERMLEAMRHLGMQEQEEIKEEPEKRLQRLFVYFSALVEAGTLTLSARPLPS